MPVLHVLTEIKLKFYLNIWSLWLSVVRKTYSSYDNNHVKLLLKLAYPCRIFPGDEHE